MPKHDELGIRMKSNYENRSKTFLTRRMPVILRLDGKAFHTFTRGCEKPFDQRIIDTMVDTAQYLVENIQGAKLAYVQSDEISILLTDYDRLETQAWFDYSVQKMCSIAVAMASVFFTKEWNFDAFEDTKLAFFDCRAFSVPVDEVLNCFRWRFMDWQRNSVSMLAQSLFSQKELHGKSCVIMCEMCEEKGQPWQDLGDQLKNGTCVVKNNAGEWKNWSPNMMEMEFRLFLDSLLKPEVE